MKYADVLFTRFRVFFLASSFIAAPAITHAQELRGTVVAPDGTTPAGGVVVILVHATRDDSIVARTITSDRGRFSLNAPAVVSTRLKLLRIGYAPMPAGNFALAAGEVRDISIRLSDARVQLNAVDVKATSRCDVRPEGSRLVAQLFQEARTALIATTARTTGTASSSQYISFRREQDRRGRPITPVQRTTSGGATLRPYASISADSLSRRGYVVDDVRGVMYYAPDADVLLSDKFLSTHCLVLVQGKDKQASLIGIGFRPIATRTGLVDVRGTLWLDRATSELQYLEYTYEPLDAYLASAGLGGRVDYAQLSTGGWFVNSWSIRMPRLAGEQSMVSGSPSGISASPRMVVSGLSIAGGEVQTIRVDDQVLYLNTNATHVGDMPGDAADEIAAKNGADLAADVESRNAMSACAAQMSPEHEGIVKGRVVDVRRSAVAGGTVRAEWKEQFQHDGSIGWRWKNFEVDVPAADNGTYTICGLPVNRPVTLSLKVGSVWRSPAVVRVTEREPAAQLDLTVPGASRTSFAALDKAQSSSVQLTLPTSNVRGARVRDGYLFITNAIGQPVKYANVSLNGGVTSVADASGRVSLNNSGGDTIQVAVRRMGYRTFQGNILRHVGDEQFTLVLLPDGQSQTVRAVRDSANNPLERAGFYDRLLDSQRGPATGEFMTPEQVDARAAGRFSQLLANSRLAKVDALAIVPVLRSRGGCAMAVLVDGRRINNLYDGTASGEKAGTVTIDELVGVNEIAAVELYERITTAPAALRRIAGDGSCGLAVLWTGGR